eukprot:m.122479 g.122479  ORF g.122479 m.122479 type:complete len:323 (-) comp17277_c0_seq4:1624-2592(-)
MNGLQDLQEQDPDAGQTSSSPLSTTMREPPTPGSHPDARNTVDPVFIDGTPGYMHRPQVPERIRQTYLHQEKHIKLVAIVRDPVERIVSHWRHALVDREKKIQNNRTRNRKGHLHWSLALTEMTLLDAFKLAVDITGNCFLKSSGLTRRGAVETFAAPEDNATRRAYTNVRNWQRCHSPQSHWHWSPNKRNQEHAMRLNTMSMLSRSLYDQQFAFWFDSFNQDNFCIVTTEAFVANATRVTSQVAEFVGLTGATVPADRRWQDTLHEASANIKSKYSNADGGWQPDAETIAYMRDFFNRISTCVYTQAVANNGILGCKKSTT